LRRSTLLEAGGAYPSSVEGVPFVPTGERPAVILAGRPAAERAADAGAGGVEAFLLIGFTIHSYGLVIFNGAHPRLPRSRATAAASKLRSGIRESQN